jgi:hypothetical protein
MSLNEQFNNAVNLYNEIFDAEARRALCGLGSIEVFHHLRLLTLQTFEANLEIQRHIARNLFEAIDDFGKQFSEGTDEITAFEIPEDVEDNEVRIASRKRMEPYKNMRNVVIAIRHDF